LFDRQVKAAKNSLTKTLFSQLETLGLVSKRKSLKELVFGFRD
jgi:ribosomal protein S19E (S16A)